MKIFNKYSILLPSLALLLGTGCSDLDLNPEGSVFTQDQKDELKATDPTKLQSDVNGLYSGLIQLESISSWFGATRHYDYGFASACMMYDASGMDMPSENSGYNWYRSQLRFTDRTDIGDNTYFLWKMYYRHMKTANDLLKNIPSNIENQTWKYYRGQALTSRAFDYLNLVQTYQFTYKGHEEALAVPLVTEETTPEMAANNPRATVKKIYEQIIKDLDEAIVLLEGFDRHGKKEFINQNVAYGLRARANLIMQNWKAAADDAGKALNGFTPYSINDVSKPTFNDIEASSWIWGNSISENNDIVKSGILNFPSMMCSFTGNGYAPGYAGRYINSELWKKIPATDVRRGWWIDEDYNSPNVDYTWRITYNDSQYGPAEWFGWNAPYLNVKFGAYKNEYNNSTNACDFPLMRAEEMYLIKAEGLAMSGDAQGKTVLENFVKTYRDPSYVCNATTPAGIQDEVWFQRRIELWGEGFSFFDLLRLKKPLQRAGTNFPAQAAYNLPAESQIFLWLIPEDEINNNAGIKKTDNNPVATVPSV